MLHDYSGVSLADPSIIADPFEVYRQLQRERPVYKDPQTGFYEITRAADIKAIASDPATFSNRYNRQTTRSATLQAEIADLYKREGFPPIPTLLDNDPPDHSMLRRLVERAFTPARTKAIAPQIDAEVVRLLDSLGDRTSVEFVSEFALPLPLNIIADQLGLERNARRIIKEGSDALINVADPTIGDDQILGLIRQVIAMQQLLAVRISVVRATPDDTLISNVSNLVDDDDNRLDIRELIHLFQSILVAGNETTTNALGSALHILALNPELADRLRADLTLVPKFVEESLRLRSPLQGFFRRATAPTEIGGVAIPEGATLVLRWAAANRDDAEFPDAQEVNLERPKLMRHFTFGYGMHYCIGNLLARAELCSALQHIVGRWTGIRLAATPDAARLRKSFFTHGPDRLLLEFTSAG